MNMAAWLQDKGDTAALARIYDDWKQTFGTTVPAAEASPKQGTCRQCLPRGLAQHTSAVPRLLCHMYRLKFQFEYCIIRKDF